MKISTIGATVTVAIFGLGLGACSDRDRGAPTVVETAPPPVTAPLPERQNGSEQFAQQLASLGGTRTGDAVKVTLAGDRFARGSGEFEAGDTIDALAELLKEHADAHVMIEGYTDDRGGQALNQRLSEARAKAVQQALVERGVDASRMEVAGRGPAQPVASNDTAEGRAQNRRVELTFSADGASRVAASPVTPPGG